MVRLAICDYLALSMALFTLAGCAAPLYPDLLTGELALAMAAAPPIWLLS